MGHGRDLLAQGIGPTCLITKCPLQLTACALDRVCGASLQALLICQQDRTLAKLKSECDPVPEGYKPGDIVPRLLDQCVGHAKHM